MPPEALYSTASPILKMCVIERRPRCSLRSPRLWGGFLWPEPRSERASEAASSNSEVGDADEYVGDGEEDQADANRDQGLVESADGFSQRRCYRASTGVAPIRSAL